MSERTQRMSELIRREVSTLIRREAKLEGLLITVASVETSPDLKHAYIYLSMIEQSLGKGRVIGILNHLRSEWQGEMGRRIGAKFTPRLHFEFDKALERGDKVMELMLEVERKKQEEIRLHPELAEQEQEAGEKSSDEKDRA